MSTEDTTQIWDGSSTGVEVVRVGLWMFVQ